MRSRSNISLKMQIKIPKIKNEKMTTNKNGLAETQAANRNGNSPKNEL